MIRATSQLSSLLLVTSLLLLSSSKGVVEASPLRDSAASATSSVAAHRSIDSLRRSIELLRQSMGAEMFENFRYDLAADSNDVSSNPAAILNIKADLRPMQNTAAAAESKDSEPSTAASPSLETSLELPQSDSGTAGGARHHHHSQHQHRHAGSGGHLGTGARRHHRQHRVRRKGCPASKGGHRQMLCPSRNSLNYDVCISVEQLCDKMPDCPQGEDEDPTTCLFYKTTREQLKQIYNTVLLLADHAVGQQQHFEL
ncbi:hypothetical protein L596_008229 [Steinernema carpocapsae]|uniref:Uncharacterized protein n=1 Tax=Steinernema carpocapsae TaxID=34508 RepID=A0A4U5PCD3_STECR|nr:hypothetical protein L596_008229 [Steinernema carpocapsae]